jgi:cytochrome c-type biogenesis protein CcmH
MVLLTMAYATDNIPDNELVLTKLQQERADYLYNIVRCPVCSGQSLAGSEATIAVDLRKIIKQKIYNNLSDKEIKNDLVKLYGDDILFEPPFNKNTFLLNYGVYGLLIIIVVSLFYYRSRQRE